MATVVPPPSKRQRRANQVPKEVDIIPDDLPHVLVQFKASDTAQIVGNNIRVPGNVTVKQLELLVNQLLENDHEPAPYSFSLQKDDNDESSLVEINDNIYTSVLKPGIKSSEDVLRLVYTPQAVFKVRAVTRCSAAISGHTGTILACRFSPNTSSKFATGAGDSTARIWDTDTQTPFHTLRGHSNWVLCVEWSPDGKTIATGSMDNTIRLWDAKTGKPIGNPLTGHSKWISSICWEPFFLVAPGKAARIASSSKDGTIKLWDSGSRTAIFTMSGHTAAVSCVKWGGNGWIYSASHDKSIKIWDSSNGRLIHTLNAHAHWVNHISLSTDFVLRTGPFFDGSGKPMSHTDDENVLRERAKNNFKRSAIVAGRQFERVVTASDDFTMYLWDPEKSTKPLARLTGHQKLVNHVSFSPDGRYIASASFDNSIKLWDGLTGRYINTFRGHVAPVYQCAWSSDSRLLVSASKDTTLKVWDVRTQKIQTDLPGSRDEIYAVDWSVDGAFVASGGKDKQVRIWRH